MNVSELRKRYEELRDAREREEAAVVKKTARAAKILRELTKVKGENRGELLTELAAIDAELRAAPSRMRKLLKEEAVAHIELMMARVYDTDWEVPSRVDTRAKAIHRRIRILYGVDVSAGASRRRVEQQLESRGYLDRQTERFEELVEQVL